MSIIVWAGCTVALIVYLSRRRRPERTRKSSFRKRLIRKFGHRCMVCGRTKNIVAHHINHYADNGSDDPDKNGILLCSNCHSVAHRGQLSKRRLRKLRRKSKSKN